MTRFNFYLGASASAWLLAILVIGAELSHSFKAFLKVTFTHHWIAKAVLITLAFIIAGFLFSETKKIGSFPDDKFAWNSVRASLLIIFLFYIIEFLT